MLSVALTVVLAALPADDPAPGFAIENLPTYAGEVTRTLSSGEVLVLGMDDIRRHSPDGTSYQNVYTFPVGPFVVYPISLAVDEAETMAVVSRDDGNIPQTWRIDLATGVAVQIGNTATTCMAVDSSTRAYFSDWHVIAGIAEVGVMDLTDGSSRTAIDFEYDRVMWTLARDAAGNLYVPSGVWAEVWEIRKFTAAQLASGAPLSRTDGQLIADGLSDVTSIAVDPSGAVVYAVEDTNNFFRGNRRIIALDGSAAPRELALLDEAAGVSSLEFLPGPGPAELRAFQPAGGGELVHTSGSTTTQRYRLAAARPSASVSGAGTSGTGPFDLEVAGGPMGGSALFFYDLAANVLPSEVYYPLSVPLAMALSPATARRVPGIVPLDATGSGSVGFVNPTGSAGVWALQAIVLDAGGQLAGSTTTTIL